MARHGTAWNGMVWYGETITGQEHNTHSGKEAHTLSIKTPLHAPLRPQCNHFAIVCAWTFSLHFAAASTITTAATRNRNKNNKLLALSWHIDNKLIIPRFVSLHLPLPITHHTSPIRPVGPVHSGMLREWAWFQLFFLRWAPYAFANGRVGTFMHLINGKFKRL